MKTMSTLIYNELVLSHPDMGPAARGSAPVPLTPEQDLRGAKGGYLPFPDCGDCGHCHWGTCAA